MEEKWKQVRDYDYIISNKGRIRSLKTNKIIKPYPNKSGYIQVKLCKNGKAKNFYLHRLVAEAFIGKYGCMVNHKDEVKANNRVENLEWCDCGYNNNYGTRNERISKAKGIGIYCLENDTYYNSINKASEDLKISWKKINRLLNECSSKNELHFFLCKNLINKEC